MAFLNVKECKKFCHDNNKQLSKDAIEALNARVKTILTSAVISVGGFKRIGATEVNFKKS
jgi:hypothetical protein